MQETLNAKLRNRVGPLQTYIDILKKMSSEVLTDKENKIMMNFILDKKNIEALEDLREFLIG